MKRLRWLAIGGGLIGSIAVILGLARWMTRADDPEIELWVATKGIARGKVITREWFDTHFRKLTVRRSALDDTSFPYANDRGLINRLGNPPGEAEDYLKDKWGQYIIDHKMAVGEILSKDYLVDRRLGGLCHPGCFPAGTPILTATGPRPVQVIRPGESVTAIDPTGARRYVPVTSLFSSCTALYKIETDRGSLVTSGTQPLALAGGGQCVTSELAPGMRLLKVEGERIEPAVVGRVTPLGEPADVFNLVLGQEPQTFVASGFVVRSKPPAHQPGAPAPAPVGHSHR